MASAADDFLYDNNNSSMDYRHNFTDDLDNDTINLEDILGPRRQPLIKIIPVTIVYIIIFIAGTVGNIVTCIVITRNKYMHTTTNYYLFSLAISDLLVLFLGLPQETYTFWSEYPWIFGEAFCIIRTFAAETSTYASILTITAFTVERYIAICHPLKAHTVSTLSRAVRVIILIWIIAGICAIPMAMQFGLRYVHDPSGARIPGSAVCNIKEGADMPHSFETATFLFFFAPMTIITVLYVMIGVTVRRSQSRMTRRDSDGNDMSGTEWRCQQQAKARKAVLKMLVAVVVAFFICWAPFHAQRLIFIYCKVDVTNPTFMYLHTALLYISGVLYYVSSTINPILYNIMSLKFREAFKNTILACCRKGTRQRGNLKVDTSRYNHSETHYSWADQATISQRNFNRVNRVALQASRFLSGNVNGGRKPRSHKSGSEECLRLSNRDLSVKPTECENKRLIPKLIIPEVRITQCNGSSAKVHIHRHNSMDIGALGQCGERELWVQPEPSRSDSNLHKNNNL